MTALSRQRFFIMNNNNEPSQTNAKMNQGIGQAKQKAGDLLGNERMQGEGYAQNTGGKMEELGAKAQQAFAKAKDDITNAFSGGGKSSQ